MGFSRSGTRLQHCLEPGHDNGHDLGDTRRGLEEYGQEATSTSTSRHQGSLDVIGSKRSLMREIGDEVVRRRW